MATLSDEDPDRSFYRRRPTARGPVPLLHALERLLDRWERDDVGAARDEPEG